MVTLLPAEKKLLQHKEQSKDENSGLIVLTDTNYWFDYSHSQNSQTVGSYLQDNGHILNEPA